MESDPKSQSPEDDASPAGQAISESKMRQALGIEQRGGERHATVSYNAGAPRRRFVADGDVPVVMIGRRRDHAPNERADHTAALAERLSALEAQLAFERDARTRAEALLAEARQTIQHLQTQVAHAELAREEAVAQARRAMTDRSDALRELQDAQRAPPPAAEPIAPPPPTPPAARALRASPPLPANPSCDVPAFTAQILSAYLARNKLSPTELPGLAESVMHALVAAAPQS